MTGTFSGEIRPRLAMLCPTHMKTMRCRLLPLAFVAGLLATSVSLPAQSSAPTPGGQVPERGAARPAGAARAPKGSNPAAQAVLPETTPGTVYGLGEERDAERLFGWLELFQPALTPAQIVSFRQNVRDRLGEMRMLEDRRRTLLRELLQLSVTEDAKTEKLREKATALGQAVTELAIKEAEILRSFQPALSSEQRTEIRQALAQAIADGYEPFSFSQPQSRPGATAEPTLPEILGYPPGPGYSPGAPGPNQPRQAPLPRQAPTAPLAPPTR